MLNVGDPLPLAEADALALSKLVEAARVAQGFAIEARLAAANGYHEVYNRAVQAAFGLDLEGFHRRGGSIRMDDHVIHSLPSEEFEEREGG